jgi:pimeloyl-ACP methyl ester carboxylesterase
MTVSITRHLVQTRFGQIHCRQAGASTSPAIVALHINQQSSALFVELMRALAPSTNIVAMDYPSHGMSDHVDGRPSITDYAECAVAVMDKLGARTFTSLGEATGAAVAVELGIRYPDRVEGVVMLNCPYYSDQRQAEQAHQSLKVDLRPADASGFPLTRTLEFVTTRDPTHAPLRPDQSWMDRINVAQIEVGRHRWQALDALHDYDIGAALQQLDRDALLLMGEHFHYTSQLETYRRLLRKLVAAEVVAGARFGMAWEKAAEVATHVNRFLTRNK